MPSKEQVYTKQLQELGIWEEAFKPLVKDLSQAERQRTRAQKEWSDKAKAEAKEKGADPAKARPSFSDELWAVICDLDKKILAYREALGLTPKALRRLRGQPTAAAGPTAAEEISAKLDRMLQMEDVGTSWSYEELVSGLDTGQETPSTAGPPQSAALTAPPEGAPVPLPQSPQAAGGGKSDG